MNTRIIELIQNPQLIQAQDLDLLQKEIETTPYLQPVRALHLLGTAKFDSEKYRKYLSVTAAYTTDKKILYHLINGQPSPKIGEAESDIVADSTVLLNPSTENKNENKNTITDTAAEMLRDFSYENSTSISQEKPLSAVKENAVVEEEIQTETTPHHLPETENHSQVLDIPTEEISLENEPISENPKISVHPESIPKVLIDNNISIENNESVNFSTNENLDLENRVLLDSVEEPTSGKENRKENEQEINFHKTSDFLSQVKVLPPHDDQILKEAPQQYIPDSEAERQRLIAEVEKKMMERKSISKTHSNTVEKQETPESNTSKKKTEETQEIIPTENKVWKPMGVSNVLYESSETLIKTEDTESSIPVINVSFFSPTIAEIKTDDKNTSEMPAENPTKEASSNVPQFLNTWQSWLKIDRNNPLSGVTSNKNEIKQKAIERFIEAEPKISPLKNEVPITIKEKKGDISHLMTETLASLYVAQKHYTKAIAAYESLIQKHPEKEIYFLEKIIEIKKTK